MANTRMIVAGALIDGSGGSVRKDVFLAVTDGVITAIGPTTKLERNNGAAIDDFSHCVILPALVDCSVSLAQSPSVDAEVRRAFAEAGPEQKGATVAQHLRYCHGHGVLGLADNDDPSSLLQGEQGDTGPAGIVALRLAGRIIKSWQDCVGFDPAGVDFLKIGYSATIAESEAPTPRLSPDEMHNLLAQRGGKRAVVVANGQQAVAEALAAGCDAIEQGYGMGEANLRRMAEQGVLWIPSVGLAKNGLDGSASGGEVCCRFSIRYVAPGKPVPGAEAFWKKMLAEQLAQLRLARELGVQVAVGTGAGSIGMLHGESMAEEIKLLIKAGYPVEEVVRCASENGARFFGMENLGALTVGRRATFLISRGTVQQLPRKLSYLEGIYVDGLPSRDYRKNPVRVA